MTQGTTASQPLSTPASFPVHLEAGEERIPWHMDRMHFPKPITPMMADFGLTYGFNAAFRAFGVPAIFHSRRINTYHYEAVTPLALTAEEGAEAGRRAEERVGAAIARLRDVWELDFLPKVKEHLAYLEGFDLAGASADQFRAHLDEVVYRHGQLWSIHFQTVLPAMVAMSLFEEFYREIFAPESTFDAFKLTQGFENLTVKAGHELWRLSRRGAASPAVRSVLANTEVPAIISALEGSSDGRAFLAELRGYLEEYGQRGAEQFFELAEPSLLEDPTPLLRSIKDFATQDDRDLDAELAVVAADRDRLVGEARARLASYPEKVRDQFEFLLGAAQAGTVISEDHNFYIDYRSTYQIRRVLLEAGRRLTAAGALDSADGVFMLTLQELRDSLRDPSAFDRRAVARERRAEMEHFARVTPPPALGTPPAGPPPQDALSRTLFKFFGGPPQATSRPGELLGNPGSPGKVWARARVLRAFSDAAKLQPGEVLVAETTAPPWTPIFALAAAVVTDTGGVLSHAAVVAREYGIPAVVGMGTATSTIRDGQLLEVDGDAGAVRLLD